MVELSDDFGVSGWSNPSRHILHVYFLGACLMIRWLYRQDAGEKSVPCFTRADCACLQG